MIDPAIELGISKQLNAEVASALLYLQMASWFEVQDLPGFGHWMRMQYQEELTHVHKFFAYVHNRDGKITIEDIPAPINIWPSAVAVMQATYEHECTVSRLINDLVSLALEKQDHATYAFLQWFVTEQVEEESTAKLIAGKLRLIGDDGAALLQLDNEMAKRPAPALPLAGG
jgi:ferritin